MPEAGILAALRERRPLVHCISNIVSANDCANLLLSAGASPMMAEAPEEMARITAISDSTVLNTGTPSAAKYEAARICMAESARLNKPVVLDPVGVGASEWRLEHVGAILAAGSPDIIRVNLAEAEALIGLGGGEQGVDSPGRHENGPRERAAAALAGRYGCAVLLTGESDIVSDGERTETVTGGSALMPYITGSGCMLSALCGAFLAVERDAFAAALFASRYWKRCGELAERACAEPTPANVRVNLINAAFRMADAMM